MPDPLEDRVTAVEADIVTLTAVDTAVDGRVDDVDDAISAIQAVDVLLDGRVTIAEQTLIVLDERIDYAEDNITVLDGRLDVIDGGLVDLGSTGSSLGSRLDGVDNNIAAMDGRLDDVDVSIAALVADDIVVAQHLDALDGDVDNLQNADTALSGRLDTAEGDIQQLEITIATEGARFDAIEGDISDLQAATTAAAIATAIDASVTAEDTLVGAISAKMIVAAERARMFASTALFDERFDEAAFSSAFIDEASFASSGNARLLRCYGGTNTWVYHKAKAGEVSFDGGRRVENKWNGGPLVAIYGGDGVAPTITAGRPDPFGGTTAVRIQASRLTADTLNYSGAGYAFSSGSLFPEVSGNGIVSYYLKSASGVEHTVFISTGGASGIGAAVVVTSAWKRFTISPCVISSGSSHSIQILAYLATVGLAIDVDVAGIQCEDVTGYVNLVSPGEYTVPDHDYGFGANGVRWFATTNGNTVDVGQVVTEAGGVALPEPMGVSWQPAATNLVADSPPTWGGTNCVYSVSPVSVAGLPAARWTATDDVNVWIGVAVGVHTGAVHCSLLVKKPAHESIVTIQYYYVGGSNPEPTVTSNAAWTELAANNAGVLAKKITNLGNGNYLIDMVVAAEGNSATLFCILKKSSGLYFDVGQYLDIASFTCCNIPYAGTPLLAAGSQTSRVIDDPSTGLPAIGTGPFTAFIDITAHSMPPASGWFPFSINGASGGFMYMLPSGLAFYRDNLTGDYVPGVNVVPNQRTRIVMRRSANGNVAVFTDGVLRIEVSSSNYSGAVAPIFGVAGYMPDATYHAAKLYYHALSNGVCAAMTDLGS